jgi:hypothetical protein
MENNKINRPDTKANALKNDSAISVRRTETSEKQAHFKGIRKESLDKLAHTLTRLAQYDKE